MRARAGDRPNLAAAHAWIGLAKYLTGRNEETEAHILEALRISPRDTCALHLDVDRGVRQVCARLRRGGGRLAQPVDRAKSESSDAPFPASRPRSPVSAVSKKRAKPREQGLDLNPSFTIARYRSSAFSDNPVYLAGRERMYEGMRLAGIPEG